MDKRHGSPNDRGAADAYYRRPYQPHYFEGATYSTPIIEQKDMTADEVADYKQGFDEQHASGDFKDYG